jgi:hypothetical protein
MTTRFVGITGSGTGDGSTWGNAPAAFPTGLATVLAASSTGDTIKIEAGVHPPISASMNWTKKGRRGPRTACGPTGNQASLF